MRNGRVPKLSSCQPVENLEDEKLKKTEWQSENATCPPRDFRFHRVRPADKQFASQNTDSRLNLELLWHTCRTNTWRNSIANWYLTYRLGSNLVLVGSLWRLWDDWIPKGEEVSQTDNLPKLRAAGDCENQITGRTLYAFNAYKSVTRERLATV